MSAMGNIYYKFWSYNVYGISFVKYLSTEWRARAMNLLENKEFLRGLLRQSDLLNTVNGGVSLPSFSVQSSEEVITVKVSAPAVSFEAYKILLDHKNLIIYAEVSDNKGEDSEEGASVKYPLFMRSFEIPSMVDSDKIEAYFEDKQLRILLPFKNQQRLQRLVPIKSI